MNSEIIKLLKISKKFTKTSSDISVFKNINISINKGELVALTGPSGSGKSTLLHIIALLDQPTSGEVYFNKKNFSKSNDKEKDLIRQKGISIIYQQNNLLSDFTALENVAMPLVNNNYSWQESIKQATKLLTSVNLSNRLNHFPSELSGGEQQRVAIARSLVAETELILADEPTGNLDFKTSSQVFSYFLKLKKLKKTIIYATHNRDLASKADYKLSISNGTIKRVNG